MLRRQSKMIACTSPPQRKHRVEARRIVEQGQGASLPPRSSQPMYAAGSSLGETVRHEGVRAERPSIALAPRFRNEREDERDDALVISEVHGVVRSVVRRDQYAGGNPTHRPPPPPPPPPLRSTWNETDRGNRSSDWGRQTRVPTVHIAPRDQPNSRYPPQAWTYLQRGSTYGSVVNYQAARYWRENRDRSQAGRVGLVYERGHVPPSEVSRLQPSLIARPEIARPAVAVPPPAAVARLAEGAKRALSPRVSEQITKKFKGFDKLDLLCTATLDVGPLHDNPLGCSCPKSKCVALYCDCFKAGRRCDPKTCSCLSCKNTVAESGPEGARTKAIRCILARNPRAFTTAGLGNPLHKLPPGEVACNCIRSRCLKLYCSCFQAGKACNVGVCTCVGCLNTEEDPDGRRKQAIQQCLEKRPDAFKTRVREKGLGCACKNNRCIRKYCECFRTNRQCSEKCSCRLCANQGNEDNGISASAAVADISINGRIAV